MVSGAWCASTPSLCNRITTPDTRHTQVSVQFTTLRHPSQFLMSHTPFCAETIIQWYSLQNNFHVCIRTICLENDLAVINAYSRCVHPPLWPLALIFLLFFQHSSFLCPNWLQCSHLILSFAFLFKMNWNSLGFDFLSNGIASFTGNVSLNPGFNAGLTPLSAQTAVAFVNQTAKCFLSLSNFGICFKLVESIWCNVFCLLASFSFCFLPRQLLLSFLK